MVEVSAVLDPEGVKIDMVIAQELAVSVSEQESVGSGGEVGLPVLGSVGLLPPPVPVPVPVSFGSFVLVELSSSPPPVPVVVPVVVGESVGFGVSVGSSFPGDIVTTIGIVCPGGLVVITVGLPGGGRVAIIVIGDDPGGDVTIVVSESDG